MHTQQLLKGSLIPSRPITGWAKSKRSKDSEYNGENRRIRSFQLQAVVVSCSHWTPLEGSSPYINPHSGGPLQYTAASTYGLCISLTFPA